MTTRRFIDNCNIPILGGKANVVFAKNDEVKIIDNCIELGMIKVSFDSARLNHHYYDDSFWIGEGLLNDLTEEAK